MRPRVPLAERFWPKVAVAGPNDCWEWLANRCNGYGQIGFEHTKLPAHRVAYELMVGPIPDGLVIDHLCRNRGCVNPAHMEPVTNAENIRRGYSPYREATHCPRGHPYDTENTYRRPSRPLARDCKACRSFHMKNWRARRNARLAATSSAEPQIGVVTSQK